MKRQALGAVTLLAGMALAGAATAALQDENILVPLPSGFKVGYHVENAKNLLSEYVPVNEDVDHWTMMVTERIVRGAAEPDPEAAQSAMLSDWKGACPGSTGGRISNSQENGYRVSYWRFDCPLNPQTRQPESMVRKVTIGRDALYDVQFAHRRAATEDMVKSAVTYLRSATVCDTRTPDHPCPTGLTPVSSPRPAAANPVGTFLQAADIKDAAAMQAVLNPASSGFLKQIDGCYLRRLYAKDSSKEIIAAWMCALGPNRSRVVLAGVAPSPDGKVSVSVRQDTVDDRPAPERTGSVFVK